MFTVVPEAAVLSPLMVKSVAGLVTTRLAPAPNKFSVYVLLLAETESTFIAKPFVTVTVWPGAINIFWFVPFCTGRNVSESRV